MKSNYAVLIHPGSIPEGISIFLRSGSSSEKGRNQDVSFAQKRKRLNEIIKNYK